jgi:Contractile injection system tube protein
VIPVHFDPQTLKISYSNNTSTSPQSKQHNAPQKVSVPSSRLTFELLFDTTEAGTDVRVITSGLANIVAPGNTGSGAAPSDAAATPDPGAPKGVDTPLGIQFRWGSFTFSGTLDSMDETLDYFAEDGTALRSTVSLTITSHDYKVNAGSGQNGASGVGAGIGVSASASIGVSAGFAGTTAIASVQVGASLQGMAASVGASADWKSIASANGIDNPLRLQSGASINLSARTSVGS